MAGTYVVGDIHGGLKALKQAMEQLPSKPDDQFIFLGDYLDGWSHSHDVIEYLFAFSKTRECIFLKGNHESWALSWFQGEQPGIQWLQHGGKSTIDSYPFFSMLKRRRHLAFFESMLDFYVDSKQRLFVHAGFTSERGPLFEPFLDNLYFDRSLWELAVAQETAQTTGLAARPPQLNLYSEIFIGHTPTLLLGSFEPVRAATVWNMDTGAGFHGRLSIMDIESKQVWQSEPLNFLYPNEAGRMDELAAMSV